jgi:hypothetical protein
VVGVLFPETNGFVITTNNKVISKNNYTKYILEDPKFTNDIPREIEII